MMARAARAVDRRLPKKSGRREPPAVEAENRRDEAQSFRGF
jgi:hypothetical protein